MELIGFAIGLIQLAAILLITAFGPWLIVKGVRLEKDKPTKKVIFLCIGSIVSFVMLCFWALYAYVWFFILTAFG